MKDFTLTNGKIITAQEIDIEGMAGEPMTVLQFSDSEGTIVPLASIINEIADEDQQEVENWSQELYEANYISAINWTI